MLFKKFAKALQQKAVFFVMLCCIWFIFAALVTVINPKK